MIHAPPGFFRLFLAAVVLFYHTTRFVFVGHAAVYIFFMLSGYWITQMYDRKYVLSDHPLAKFFISRLWRILPVFFATACLAYVVTRIGWGDVPASIANDGTWFLRSIVLIGTASTFPRIIETQWSLDIEMQFYFVFPFLFYGLSRRSINYVAAAGSCVAVFAIAFGYDKSLCIYLPFFLVGISISFFDWRPSTKFVRSSVFIIGGLFLAVYLLPPTRTSIAETGELNIRGHDLTAIFNIGIALLAVPFVAYNVRNRDGKWSRRAGDFSYPLYLVHWVLLGPFLFFSAGSIGSEKVILFTVYLLGTFVTTLCIYGCIDRPIERVRRAFSTVRKTSTSPSDVLRKQVSLKND